MSIDLKPLNYSPIKYFSALFLYLFISIFITNTYAAEGGPCKDYGECEEFKHSLTDMPSLQSGASTYIES